jgi:hypothetical protein
MRKTLLAVCRYHRVVKIDPTLFGWHYCKWPSCAINKMFLSLRRGI